MQMTWRDRTHGPAVLFSAMALWLLFMPSLGAQPVSNQHHFELWDDWAELDIDPAYCPILKRFARLGVNYQDGLNAYGQAVPPASLGAPSWNTDQIIAELKVRGKGRVAIQLSQDKTLRIGGREIPADRLADLVRACTRYKKRQAGETHKITK